MSDTASTYVEEAADKASWMVNREVRGPGDVDNAMRRLESRLGISYATFWALRYKRPKSIGTEIFVRICEAFEMERAMQRKRFNEEDSRTHPKTWFGEVIARASRAVAGSEDGVVS